MTLVDVHQALTTFCFFFNRFPREDPPKKYYMTISVSFGECRELAFFKKSGSPDNNAGDNSCLHFHQPNNGVFTVGANVSTRFQQGIHSLPPKDQHGKGRITILLHAWATTDKAVKDQPETTGPAVVTTSTGEEPAPESKVDEPVPEEKKKAKLTKKQEKRREQRKAWRLQKMQERRAANGPTSPTEEVSPNRTDEGDADTIDGDTVDA